MVYPPNYNVTMAERLIPAADLSEQISTAGKEASGTGNMKLSLNGALTIGTLDGANVEIREHVGADTFFLFGLTAEEVVERRKDAHHARHAIMDSQKLQDVLQMLAEGRFSPDQPDRYHGVVDRVWHHDYFLVASDFASYDEAQGKVAEAFRNADDWARKAARNTARMGYFSSDRAVRGYMKEIWSTDSAL
ncbi:MAG: glycogen/starch/alpha-glucan phosphorylase [Rhodobacteraceae bacterium]|nr:glycogen/starch/alpha-glucan phosphorylase [Paracoccaceae bacterium]